MVAGGSWLSPLFLTDTCAHAGITAVGHGAAHGIKILAIFKAQMQPASLFGSL